MSVQAVTQQQVLEELQRLQPERWSEVVDFIGYLKDRDTSASLQARPVARTAQHLSQSELVGLWAGREDIHDSLEFARHLRRDAEHRQRPADDSR